MPGTPLSASDIMTRFNNIVTSAAPYFNSAPWHETGYPKGYDSRFGNRSETAKTAANLTTATRGNLASTVVFNVLHGFAMELTRVRRVASWHRTDAAPEYGGINTAALQPQFASYFPLTSQPIPGDPVTDTDLTAFLTYLRGKVIEARSYDTFRVDIVTCHNSCHCSCHASRNRR